MKVRYREGIIEPEEQVSYWVAILKGPKEMRGME
jgi:hypothetical protein